MPESSPSITLQPNHRPRPPEHIASLAPTNPRTPSTPYPFFHFGDVVRWKRPVTHERKDTAEGLIVYLSEGTVEGLVVDRSVDQPGTYHLLVGTRIHQVKATDLQWIAKRPYRKAKIHYLFSQETPAFHEAVKYDEVSLYSATDQLTARATARVLRTLPGVTAASTVTDATACIGGNTLEFARAFAHVHAVELEPVRASMLRHNLAWLQLDKSVTVHEADYCDLQATLCQDVVFLDPPWGGKRYKQQERVRLYLSDRDVGDLCGAILLHTAHVVVKVPCNFDVRHFAQTVQQRVRVLKLTGMLLLIVSASSSSVA